MRISTRESGVRPPSLSRGLDDQAGVDSCIGVVAWDPAFPDFAVWKDAAYTPGDQ
jgi:hypothetical protein